MTTRRDGKHYKLGEIYDSDIITLMEIETWYSKELAEEKNREKQGIKGTISPDEMFNRW